MNIKRGLFRIWILLALGCWGVNGYVAYDSFESREHQSWIIDRIEDKFYAKRMDYSEYKKKREVAMVLWREADRRLTASLWGMVAILIWAIILYFLSGWVVRSFRENLEINDPALPRAPPWKKWWEKRTAGQKRFATFLIKVVSSVFALLVLFVVAVIISDVTTDKKFITKLSWALFFPSLVAIWYRTETSKRIAAAFIGSFAGIAIWGLGVAMFHSGLSTNPFIISAVVSSSMLASSALAFVVCRRKKHPA